MKKQSFKKETIVISLGGSIIVPEKGKIDVRFLKNFRSLILKLIRQKYRFLIITGGGKTCRMYLAAALKIAKLSIKQQDWLGIEATKINACLLKNIFQEKACSKILTDPFQEIDSGCSKKPIIIASGWKPGWSTDYVAVLLAKRFRAGKVINASNISFVYDKEKNNVSEISWKEYKKVIAKKWKPGLSTPFDPIASREAEKSGLTVAVIKGTNLKNLEKALSGKKFKGTIIK
jgi:uridylate kinase